MKRPSQRVLQAICRLAGSHDWNEYVDWLRESLAEDSAAMYRAYDDPERMKHLAGGCHVMDEQIEAFDTAPKQLEETRNG